MKRSQFSEEQIINILQERKAGLKVANLCRQHRVSDATFYKWKTRYGEREVSETKRLKTLENENGRLKRLMADAMLDNAALKEIVEKNGNACPIHPGGFRPERTMCVRSGRRGSSRFALYFHAT